MFSSGLRALRISARAYRERPVDGAVAIRLVISDANDSRAGDGRDFILRRSLPLDAVHEPQYVADFHLAFVLVSGVALISVLDFLKLDADAGAVVSGHQRSFN